MYTIDNYSQNVFSIIFILISPDFLFIYIYSIITYPFGYMATSVLNNTNKETYLNIRSVSKRRIS